MAGLAWTVFGVLHFGYHVTHLTGSATDIAGNIISLGINAILGVILVIAPHPPNLAPHDSRPPPGCPRRPLSRAPRPTAAARDSDSPPASFHDHES